jgi:hypothetical protein
MDLDRLMELLSRIAFASASLVLMAMSLALVVYGGVELVLAATRSWSDLGVQLVSAIGYW